MIVLAITTVLTIIVCNCVVIYLYVDYKKIDKPTKFIEEVRKLNKKAEKNHYKKNKIAIDYIKGQIMNAAEKGKYSVEISLDTWENYDLDYITNYFKQEGFNCLEIRELRYVNSIIITIQWDKD